MKILLSQTTAVVACAGGWRCKTPLLRLPLLLSAGITASHGESPHQAGLCRTGTARAQQRPASAANFPAPQITSLSVNGNTAWTAGAGGVPPLTPGDEVSLTGSVFGAGTDIDFSKIMIGNTRILETDLKMFQQLLAINDQVNFETDEQIDSWPKNILSWNDSEIRFRVPDHVSGGALI